MPFEPIRFVGAAGKLETLLMYVRPVSVVLIVLGALVLVPVFTVGFERFRKMTNGPMGEVLLCISLFCHGLVLSSWWIPAKFLR